MSSGNATTSQTSGLSSAFAPFLGQYAGALGQVSQLPFQQYSGPRVANLSPVQQQAQSGYNPLLSNPGWGQAGQTLSDLSSGNMNPFTQDVIARTQRPVIDAYDAATAGNTARFNTDGNWGGDRQQLAQDRTNRDLAMGLGDATGQLYSNAYENAQQRRLGAVQGAGSLASTYGGLLSNATQAGDIPRQQQQQVMDTAYQDWQRAIQYPYQQLGVLTGGIGGLTGAAPQTQTTIGPPPDRVAQGIGGLALANAAARSGK